MRQHRQRPLFQGSYDGGRALTATTSRYVGRVVAKASELWLVTMEVRVLSLAIRRN